MERFLLLWDDLDDLSAAARHLAGAALEEAVSTTAPIATVATALIAFVLGSLPRA